MHRAVNGTTPTLLLLQPSLSRRYQTSLHSGKRSCCRWVLMFTEQGVVDEEFQPLLLQPVRLEGQARQVWGRRGTSYHPLQPSCNWSVSGHP